MKGQKKSNYNRLKSFQLSNEEKSKTKGGFFFRMMARTMDYTLCEIERQVSIQTGGNGSGDW